MTARVGKAGGQLVGRLPPFGPLPEGVPGSLVELLPGAPSPRSSSRSPQVRPRQGRATANRSPSITPGQPPRPLAPEGRDRAYLGPSRGPRQLEVRLRPHLDGTEATSSSLKKDIRSTSATPIGWKEDGVGQLETPRPGDFSVGLQRGGSVYLRSLAALKFGLFSARLLMGQLSQLAAMAFKLSGW